MKAIRFVSEPKELNNWYDQLVCPIECYARYYYAYKDQATELFGILGTKGITELNEDERKKLLKAYIIVRCLMSIDDSDAGKIDTAK